MNQELKPHKHAAAIKAWADGAEIQQRDVNEEYWKDCRNTHTCTPLFGDPNTEFRVKPEVPKYRRYIQRYMAGDLGVNCMMDWEAPGFNPENRSGFGGWIDTEWLSMPDTVLNNKG